jgi:hypothetical protein
MDTVQQAAQVLAEHEWQTLSVLVGCRCRCGWDAIQHMPHTAHQAAMIADAGLLVDTRCRKCNGTGGTERAKAYCAVCDGAGHRRAET